MRFLEVYLDVLFCAHRQSGTPNHLRKLLTEFKTFMPLLKACTSRVSRMDVPCALLQDPWRAKIYNRESMVNGHC